MFLDKLKIHINSDRQAPVMWSFDFWLFSFPLATLMFPDKLKEHTNKDKYAIVFYEGYIGASFPLKIMLFLCASEGYIGARSPLFWSFVNFYTKTLAI